MSNLTMIIRHICFSGPIKEPAYLEFGYGLNLVYGASNTGKSSVLDALDYMLGREKELKEISEHVGYDRIFMGIEFSNDEKITLVRSISGGDFQCFKGLHYSIPNNVDFTLLKEKKPTKKTNNVSGYILDKIGLENKKIKTNAKNETEKVSLRTLLPLFLVTETNIQKDLSPFHTVQFTKSTAEKSRLKLLLTGVDDSSLISAKVKEKTQISRAVRIEILDELIVDQLEKMSPFVKSEDSLDGFLSQHNKLSTTIEKEKIFLEQIEGDYLETLAARNSSREALLRGNERLSEINEMLAKFKLLKHHYETDLLRLGSIAEAGALITAMSTSSCPLCGANQKMQKLDHECDGNIDGVVEAATAEILKIDSLREELSITVQQLHNEASQINNELQSLKNELSKHEKILSDMSPDLSQKRTSYAELLEIKAGIDKSIDLMETLSELEEKLSLIQNDNEEKSSIKVETNLPTSVLDELAIKTQSLLKEWGLSNVERVHFDKDTDDIILNGKQRISNGKGHRSITHAAVTLGLMKYLEGNNLPSLGFTILDSPLLAYEEPDNEEDDLTGTDVNERFFDSLLKWETRQTIIFENKKSIPSKMEIGKQIVHFSKNENIGRYGFFPLTDRRD